MGLILPLAIVNVLKTLAIIIIIFYVLRWLGRIFAPIIMKRMVHKMQKQAQQQQYSQQRQNTTRTREGETVIDKKPSTNKQTNDSVGEYVDFEEID